MKSFNKLLAVFAIACVALSACQKEYTLEDDLLPPVALNDSNYLDKITIYDSSFGNNDLIRIIAYKYDSQKRVTSIIDSSDDNGFKPQKQWEYSYNGTDTVAYKSKYYRYADPGSVSDTEIVYHYYDANLKRVKDSVIQITTAGQNETIITYTYSGSNIYIWHQNYSGVPFTDTSHVDNKGNIVYSSTDIGENRFLYEFDNHPSPFVRLSNFRSLSLYLWGEEFYDYFLLRNASNYTKCIEKYATDEYVILSDYSYRSDGFPVRKRTWTMGESDYEIEKYIYRSF